MSAHQGSTVEHAQPGARTYVEVAIFLGVITAIEVATYYIEALQGIIIPVLLVLSAIKFAGVVMYYMHLKFDSRLLTGIFGWGLFVAASIMLALMALYSAF